MTAEAIGRRVTLDRAPKRERLDLRVSAEQKHLFEDAAAATARTVTDFVVQSAALAAHDVLADRTRFLLSAEQWKAFSAALDREPRHVPALAAFVDRPSVLDHE